MPYDCNQASLVYSLTASGTDGAHVTNVVTVTRKQTPPPPPTDPKPEITSFSAEPFTCPSDSGIAPVTLDWSIANFYFADDNLIRALYTDGDKQVLGSISAASGNTGNPQAFVFQGGIHEMSYDCSLAQQMYDLVITHNAQQADEQQLVVQKGSG